MRQAKSGKGIITMKTCKRGLAILVAATIGLMFLAGCNNDTTPTTVPVSDAGAKEVLQKTFDAMDAQTSVKMSCYNNYVLNLEMTTEGVLSKTELTNTYSNTYEYAKGIGFIYNAESDYSFLITVPSVSEETMLQNTKVSYFAFYDEPNDVFYNTAFEDETRWLETESMDVNGAVSALKSSILSLDTGFTIQQTNTEIQISHDVATLYASAEFQSVLTTYANVFSNVSEFTEVLSLAPTGTITYIIDPNTYLLKEVQISNIEITNAALSSILEENLGESLDDTAVMKANMRVLFSDYGTIDATKISNKGNDVVAVAIPVAERVTSTPIMNEPNMDRIEPDIVFESADLTDTHNVLSYAFKELSIPDMNQISMGGTTYTLPFPMSVLGENGWILNDVDGDGFITYKPLEFDEFSILDAYDVFQMGSYESLASDGVFGLNMNVFAAVLNDFDYPKATFTSYGITFGMTAEEVLTLLGKPDSVYIGKTADVYQYALYDMPTEDKVTAYSLMLHFYHTETVEGLYTIDIQYLAEGDGPNGN